MMHALLLANKIDALVTALGDLGQSASGMAPSRYSALVSLRHRQPMTVTALATILGLSQPATTRLVQSLRSDGLVAQARRSGREMELRLTRAGTRKAETIQRRRLEALEETLGSFGRADRKAFDKLLSRLLAGIVSDPEHARHMCRNCNHAICDGKECPLGEEIRNNPEKGP